MQKALQRWPNRPRDQTQIRVPRCFAELAREIALSARLLRLIRKALMACTEAKSLVAMAENRMRKLKRLARNTISSNRMARRLASPRMAQ